MPLNIKVNKHASMLYYSFSSTRSSYSFHPPVRKLPRLRQKNIQVFPTYISVYAHAQASLFFLTYMHKCMHTLVSKPFEYIKFFLINLLAYMSTWIQRKKFSSWLVVQLWKYFFCTSSLLKKNKVVKGPTGFSSVVSRSVAPAPPKLKMEVSQGITANSQGQHGAFKVWNKQQYLTSIRLQANY